MPQFLEHSMTSWRGQQMAHSKGLVDRIDPRARIIAVALFAIATVFSNTLLFPTVALIISLLIARQANLHFRRTLRRMIAMDAFVAIMVIMLPFTMPGTPMFEVFGFPASQEGMLKAILIALKTNAVVLALLALVGTLEATTLGHALARLHLPDKLVYLLLFTVRYLSVIGREYKRMRKAMQARAFTPRTNWHTCRSIGYLVGMLLVHSLERSERIHAAMKCRGFTGKLHLFDNFCWQRHDSLFVGAAILLMLLALLIGLGI